MTTERAAMTETAKGEGCAQVSFPCPGEVGKQSWAGLTWHPVEVLAETPKRYRVRALRRFAMPGFCGRVLEPGDVALIPKGAVRFPSQQGGSPK